MFKNSVLSYKENKAYPKKGKGTNILALGVFNLCVSTYDLDLLNV